MARAARSSTHNLSSVKPNVPPKDLFSFCTCIYGLKGVGKTSLCAQFPGAVILQLEPRRRNLRSIRQVVPTSWPDLKDWLQAFIEDKHKPTCVVDSTDVAYNMCFDYMCEQAGCDHPTDMNDYGKTWRAISDEFSSTFNQLLYADIPLIFTSHHKYREDADVNDGPDAKFAAPTCTPQAWNYLKQVCDFAFFYGYYGGKRAITVRGDEQMWAACGVDDHFLDPDGNPIRTFYAGDTTPEAAYKALLAAYDNKLYDVEGRQTKRAASSPEKSDADSGAKKFSRKLPK